MPEPVRNDFGVHPPLAVERGEVLLEDDVLEHVLGDDGAAVDQAAETVVNGQDLETRVTKLFGGNFENPEFPPNLKMTLKWFLNGFKAIFAHCCHF